MDRQDRNRIIKEYERWEASGIPKNQSWKTIPTLREYNSAKEINRHDDEVNAQLQISNRQSDFIVKIIINSSYWIELLMVIFQMNII